MRCSNPKRRCRLFDMPDGSIWFSQSEPPGDQPTGGAGKHFQCPRFHGSIFGMVLVAVGSRSLALDAFRRLSGSKQPGASYGNAWETGSSSNPLPFSVHASAQFEEELVDVG
jgi:hypothetical protein